MGPQSIEDLLLLHIITQLMSRVHGPNNKFENKDFRYWNPIAFEHEFEVKTIEHNSSVE